VLDTVIADVKNSLIAFQLSSALRAIWDVIGATNRYIVAREPWRLAKDAGRRTDLETTLYAAADALRVIAVLIEPFMPNTSARTLRMLGVPGDPTAWKTLRAGASSAGTKFGKTEALFPRIELSVEELRDMSDTNQPVTNQPVTNPAVPSGSPPAASATPSGTAPGESRGLLSIDEFMKVELRVAKVLEAERVPKSTRLLKLFVDTGVDQRTIVAGIAEAYEPAALVGRSVAIVLNLKPAKLMGIESNGMVLAASPEGGKPLLIGFDEPPPPGTRIR